MAKEGRHQGIESGDCELSMSTLTQVEVSPAFLDGISSATISWYTSKDDTLVM